MVLRLIFIIILLLAVNAGATTYYVSTSGNDDSSGTTVQAAWRNVQMACSTMVNGDSVLIRAGVYDEVSPNNAWDVAVNAGFRPVASNTTFKGYPGDALPELRGSQAVDSFRVAMHLDSRDSTVVDSIKFVKGYRAGVRLGGVNRGSRIKNCVFDSCGGGSSGDNNGAIWSYTNDQPDIVDIIITGNTIMNTWTSDAGTGGNAAGIMMYAGDSVEISNNTIYNTVQGVRLKGPFTGASKDTSLWIKIHDNIIYDCTWVGAGLGNQGQYIDIFFYDNVIYQGSNYVMDAAVSIRESAVDDSANTWGNMRTYVYNNTFDCASTMGGVFVKNTYYNASTGTFYTDSTYMFNNIYYLPKGGQTSNIDGAFANLSAEASNGQGAIGHFDSDHNLIYDTTTAGEMYHWWDTLGNRFWTLTEWVDSTTWGDNTKTGDPLFVNRGANNYNLSVGSPAATGGTTIDGYGHSWIGAKRPPRNIYKGWK